MDHYYPHLNESKKCHYLAVVCIGFACFYYYKDPNEPKKKLVLNRNPSRIEYTKFALADGLPSYQCK
jgi:hypothetical protein